MNAPRCRRCHRPLTVTVGSLGPVCARRENPAAVSARHSPSLPRRRAPVIPGQTLLDLNETQENP